MTIYTATNHCTVGTFAHVREWPRQPTPPGNREEFPSAARFEDILKSLDGELTALSAQGSTLKMEFGRMPFCRPDGWPDGGFMASGPGIILAFDTPRHGRLQFCCDQFRTWQSNLHAIALTLGALRGIGGLGATHGEQYAGFVVQGAEKAQESQQKASQPGDDAWVKDEVERIAREEKRSREQRGQRATFNDFDPTDPFFDEDTYERARRAATGAGWKHTNPYRYDAAQDYLDEMMRRMAGGERQRPPNPSPPRATPPPTRKPYTVTDYMRWQKDNWGSNRPNNYEEFMKDVRRDAGQTTTPPRPGPRYTPPAPKPSTSGAVKDAIAFLVRYSNIEPSTAQTVKKAYRKAAVKLHPDVPGGSHDLFVQLGQAKTVLERHFGKA